MNGLFLFLALLGTLRSGGDGECVGNMADEPESALWGEGFSAPPPTIELPSGWALVPIKDRLLPLPLEHVHRVGLIPIRDRVGLVVLGNEDSERLWTIDFFALTPQSWFRNSPLEMISDAIEGRWSQYGGPDECGELQALNLILGVFSTDESAYAFRQGSSVIFDAGRREENLWTAMWQESTDDYYVASWNLPVGQEGLLRNMDEDAQLQSQPHPIAKLLECAANEQPYKKCRQIEVPSVKIIGWEEL